MSAEEIMKAARTYLGAACVRRDAVRLLDIGFDTATRGARKVLAATPVTLDEAVALVAAKEANDVLELYERATEKYPEGRTADLALAASAKTARARYALGKCHLCKGPALDCAVRHARGRSCA